MHTPQGRSALPANMTLQRRVLREALVAIRPRALERTLARVHDLVAVVLRLAVGRVAAHLADEVAYSTAVRRDESLHLNCEWYVQ